MNQGPKHEVLLERRGTRGNSQPASKRTKEQAAAQERRQQFQTGKVRKKRQEKPEVMKSTMK